MPSKDPVAVGIGQPHAFALDDHPALVARQDMLLGERMKVMGGIKRLQAGRSGWP